MKKRIKYRIATLDDLPAMEKIGDHLFDNPIKPDRAKEFLNDPRHHLVLAFNGENIVGMASAFHYVHPDKDPELFINEVGVIDEFQNQSIGRTLVKIILEEGKKLNCTGAWIGTEVSNIAAQKCYKSAGGVEDEENFILINFKKL
ncbi:MAG: GNAT family N-acetyltransferase [Calditrichaeota bacterium]|nr:MAG: GNAT family N-acetyltransferase [Calditrichota bacterium]MBL1206213.1 GNAT family N-acetyltransferase [Calditrichota bacterium]NOG46038.1 GNAT family N-acetyltransferase [Calditrichota bacterium]